MNKHFDFTLDFKRPSQGRLRGIVYGESVVFNVHFKDDGEDVTLVTTDTYQIAAVYQTASGHYYTQVLEDGTSPAEDTSEYEWIVDNSMIEPGINMVRIIINDVTTMEKEFYVRPFPPDSDNED